MLIRKVIYFLIAILCFPAFAGKLDDIQDSLDMMQYQKDWEMVLKLNEGASRGPSVTPAHPYPSNVMPMNYKYIGKAKNGEEWFVDTTKITKLGNEVLLQVTTSGDFPQYHRNIVYFSSLIRMKINCSEHTSAWDTKALYSKPERLGTILDTILYNRTFSPISENTMENLVYKYVCR